MPIILVHISNYLVSLIHHLPLCSLALALACSLIFCFLLSLPGGTPYSKWPSWVRSHTCWFFQKSGVKTTVWMYKKILYILGFQLANRKLVGRMSEPSRVLQLLDISPIHPRRLQRRPRYTQSFASERPSWKALSGYIGEPPSRHRKKTSLQQNLWWLRCPPFEKGGVEAGFGIPGFPTKFQGN